MNAPLNMPMYQPEVSAGMLKNHDDWVAQMSDGVDLNKLSSEERWHFRRRLGIGASEAAAVLGLNPYKTPIEVWEEKTGRRAPADLSGNLKVRVGIKTEAVVADLYAEDHGVRLRRHQGQGMKAAPWVRCSPDRIIVGQRKGVEIKTGTLTPQWGPSGTDEVPASYLIQVAQCMAVYGFEEWDLAAELFGPGGVDLRYYPLRYDLDVVAPLLEDLTRWWFDHVIQDRRPDPFTAAEVSYAYPRDNGEAILADDSIQSQVALARELTDQIKTLDGQLADVKTEIQRFMGEASVLVDPSGAPLCTWKKAKDSERFDSDGFKKMHPALAAEFTKTSIGSRRFLFK